MFLETAVRALQEAKCLNLSYDGYERLVEVHLIGRDKNDQPIMLVWQISGGSATGERVGWKALRLQDARNAELIEIASQAPRSGYSRQNNAIKTVTHYL